jgi:hypothetical protein
MLQFPGLIVFHVPLWPEHQKDNETNDERGGNTKNYEPADFVNAHDV